MNVDNWKSQSQREIASMAPPGALALIGCFESILWRQIGPQRA